MLDETSIFFDEDDDTVGILQIHNCHVENKTSPDLGIAEQEDGNLASVSESMQAYAPIASDLPPLPPTPVQGGKVNSTLRIPRYSLNKDGIGSTELIFGSGFEAARSDNQSQIQMNDIIKQLLLLFQHIYQMNPPNSLVVASGGSTTVSLPSPVVLSDIYYVHLFLSNMDDFDAVNDVYSNFFNQQSPPSRCCVAVRTCYIVHIDTYNV